MNDHIVLAANLFRDENYQHARSIYELLTQAGHTVLFSPVFLPCWEAELLAGVPCTPLEEAVQGAKLVVVLGGDGTIIYAAGVARGLDLPIIGINLGSKGFLAGLEENETDQLLAIAAGERNVSRRMMLDVSLIRNGKSVFEQCVLNDVVIHGAQVDCIGILAKCDGVPVTNFSGDGIIVATPTGSTAYSMSAGGPLVEPDNENIILTPICAHTMTGRSFVLLPNRIVTVEPERIHDRPAVLVADGGTPISLMSGDCVRIQKSDCVTLLAETGAQSFYDRAYEKLTGRY